MANRLYEKYKKEVVPAMMKQFDLENVHEVPQLTKIIINAGVGSFRDNKEALDSFIQEVADFSGQLPHTTKARLSESGFKIRKGDVVGVAVTLRHDRMWAFLDKFINIALPRVRDFRGLSVDSFDEEGNYSVGIREHIIFPEVNPNKTKGVRSLQITLVTSTDDKERAKALLAHLGMPFSED